eukprot:1160209-Pelagomonas_calceolata.AAC.6
MSHSFVPCWAVALKLCPTEREQHKLPLSYPKCSLECQIMLEGSSYIQVRHAGCSFAGPVWDSSSVGADVEKAGGVAGVRELLTRALRGPLLPAQQQQVCVSVLTSSHASPRHSPQVLMYGLAPYRRLKGCTINVRPYCMMSSPCTHMAGPARSYKDPTS